MVSLCFCIQNVATSYMWNVWRKYGLLHTVAEGERTHGSSPKITEQTSDVLYVLGMWPTEFTYEWTKLWLTRKHQRKKRGSKICQPRGRRRFCPCVTVSYDREQSDASVSHAMIWRVRRDTNEYSVPFIRPGLLRISPLQCLMIQNFFYMALVYWHIT